MNAQQETLALIGAIVVVGQVAERILKTLLTYVLQDGKPLTYERIMELDSFHRKQTLGFFIREMKKRASFDETLDTAFERFLENRNTLIHRFDDVPGNALVSDADIKSANEFLSQLWKDIITVFSFCLAMLYTWSEKNDIEKGSLESMLSDDTHLFKHVKALSRCMDELVFSKEENKGMRPHDYTRDHS